MASIATPDDLIARWPEFSAVDPAVIQVSLDDADEEINADAWGTRAKKGECALAAHLMFQRGILSSDEGSDKSGIAGGVASIKVGDVAVAYNTSEVQAAIMEGCPPGLAVTKYGQEYWRLINTLAGQMTAEVT